MKTLLLTLLLLCSGWSASAQTWLWASPQGGPAEASATLRTNAVATDALGFSYVTGSFSGTAHFGTFTLTSRGSQDLFIARYSPGGTALWVTQLGQAPSASPFYETTASGAAIALDAAGNCFVTGTFSNEIAYGAAGVLQSFNPAFSSMLVVKCTANGEVVWAQRAGITQFSCQGTAIAADEAGNCYVTGASDFGNIQFGDIVAGQGRRVMYVASYSPQGAVRWVNTAFNELSTGVRGAAITVDNRGACYVGGAFNSAMNLEDRRLVATTTTGSDAYLARFSSRTGAVQWLRQIGGPEEETVADVETDQVGNVYVVGSYSAAAALGRLTLVSRGGSDAFLARYTRGGSVTWAQTIGEGAADRGTSLCVTADGVSTVACVQANATFDLFRTSLHSFSAEGSVGEVVLVGGAGSCQGLSLASPRPRHVYMAGTFTGNVAFGQQEVAAGAATHGFVARLLQSPRPTGPSPGEYSSLQVFPNPASDQFTAQLTTQQPTTGIATLFNSLGHAVRTQAVTATSPTRAAVIVNCGGLVPGIYVLQFRTTDGALLSREVQIQ